jgi:hypothetical protein
LSADAPASPSPALWGYPDHEIAEFPVPTPNSNYPPCPGAAPVAFDPAGYKLAEICHQYLRKGQKVYVEGRLQTRKYTDKDGIERTSVEIVASEMVMLSGREEGEGHGEGMGGPQRVPVASGTRRASADEDGYDNDVPF